MIRIVAAVIYQQYAAPKRDEMVVGKSRSPESKLKINAFSWFLLGGFVVEVGKFVSKCIYPKIENIVRFSSKIENLRKEMEKLTKFKDDIKGKVEGDEGEGYKPKPDVLKWIEEVCELENRWETMQESIAEAKMLTYKCCPNCSLRSKACTQAWKIRDQICNLRKDGENFGSNLVVENYRMKKVEFIPGPSIEGQLAATKNLQKILQLLENDKGCIIGVVGTGGVGKTTLVKNLNNELEKTNASSSKLSFGVVIWITVPKPPIIISNIQAQIAKRLNLNVGNEGSEQSSACKINERLKQEKSFLLILDDVWEALDLDDVGVPRPETTARSKVIITSRFLDVCRQMKTSIETEMMVCKMAEDESWRLFVKNAGDVVNLEDIQPYAKEITRECDGLPLAITVIGASMRGKKKVELWKDALKSLEMSEPHDINVEKKVYKVIKYSFDSFVSQDIESSSEQRSKRVNKKRDDIQSCVLYCSLYPADISTDDLIHCWWAEGFLGERDTYEEAYNRGITIIERLKDACLVDETNMFNFVKMHDVVRDVAIWIANSSENEQNSVIEAGIGLTEISHIKMSSSVKRISFVSNRIERLPDCFTKFPETTSLLLQDNIPLKKIPDELFLAFPALRVLNLSHTGITSLPSSINSLCQLRALILKYCEFNELPPIGNLCNLQVLDCFATSLHRPPQRMDKLTNLRLLNMQGCHLGSTSFDELSSLHKLTSVFINLDRSSNFNVDYTWMNRLKSFAIEIREISNWEPVSKSTRIMSVSNCETFSNGEISGMLQFASELHLDECRGLRKLIANKSFNGLQSLRIWKCSCDFRQVEEGSGQFDPLPNLEYLILYDVRNLKSVFDFSQLLGLRFSKLRQLDIISCDSLTCLFNVDGAFSVPKHLEEIAIRNCHDLEELFVQCNSSGQATLVNSEIPRVRKLVLHELPKLGRLGEPESMWEHLEELEVRGCNEIRKLPLSIQTSNKIKVIRGESYWWSQLEWDDDNFKSNLQPSFIEDYSNIYTYKQRTSCFL